MFVALPCSLSFGPVLAHALGSLETAFGTTTNRILRPAFSHAGAAQYTAFFTAARMEIPMKKQTLPHSFFPAPQTSDESSQEPLPPCNSDFVGVAEIAAIEDRESPVPIHSISPLMRMSPRALLGASIGIFIALVAGALAITRIPAPPANTSAPPTIVQVRSASPEPQSPQPTANAFATETRPLPSASAAASISQPQVRVRTIPALKHSVHKKRSSSAPKTLIAPKRSVKTYLTKASPKPSNLRGNFNP